MIKICYIIGQLGKGGAERQLYELVKGIDRKKFEPIVISLSQGGYWSEKFRKLNVQMIELERKKNREFTRLFKLIKLLKSIKPDIIHTYMFTANSYGRIAAFIAGTPIIIASERSSIEIGKDKNRFGIYIDKLLASFTHGIICNSQKASESLVKRYSFNAKKIFTVHNGINVAGFLKKPSYNPKKKLVQKIVGAVGRLQPVKNHRLFLDMAKIVSEKSDNNSIKFAIVGEGVLRNELEEYSQHLRIENKIVFLGERNDIPDLLQSMDIFVMTSLYEGMSNAIMEAMAAGLPVVATEVGGNSELVIDGETGFLCPSNDAMALADRVASLINSEKESERMGENGRKRMLNEFGIEKMIKETENIYMKLFEQRK